MSHYQDKVIWITGASAGIGEALAKKAAQEGAKLILSARREDELQRVAKACNLEEEDFLILPMDMIQYAGFDLLVKQAIAKFGQIDYLFNNAGVSSRALATETPIEVDKRIMDINYFGTIALTKLVVPHMAANSSGHIISPLRLWDTFPPRCALPTPLPNMLYTGISTRSEKKFMKMGFQSLFFVQAIFKPIFLLTH